MKETSQILLERLTAIVGEDSVKVAPDVLAAYSRDQSFTRPGRPDFVVYPTTTPQVQQVVRLANELSVPVVPRSSPVSLHGASIPTEGGILIDLGRMNRVLEINERNWYALIEPGVSFAQLQKALRRRGFRAAAPLLDPPSASVISSYLERNPVVTAADFTYGSEQMISYTVVVPSGDTFTVGHPPLENTPASSSDGPGLNFYRIFQGAQGTLGIVTWMAVRILPMPGARKIFFFPSNTVENAVEVMRRIQKSELGLECFAMNNFNLACLILGETPAQSRQLKAGAYIGVSGAPRWTANQAAEFRELRRTLPPFTVFVCLSAVGPIPREKLAYQETDLREAAAEVGAEPQLTSGGVPGPDGLLLDELLSPYRMQKRFGYRGTCHQLMFCSAPDRVGEFHEVLYRLTRRFDHPSQDIGIFLLPMERARAFYCSYDLHCDPADSGESASVRELFEEASKVLVDKGAFFDRPYGVWSQLMFSRAGLYTEYARRIKRELDPQNIMNPGKLCF